MCKLFGEGVPLVIDFEVSKARTRLCVSLPTDYESEFKLSATATVPH